MSALPAASPPRQHALRQLIVASLVMLAALLVSAWAPYDRPTWFMEVAPVLVALPLMWLTRKGFPLTPLLYALITLHALVLILGGTHTYARVPLGFWLQDWLALDRNPYDKIGHFMQGFVPVMVAREIFLRQRVVNGARMRVFLCLCVVLAISAAYELIEWAAALIMGQGADEFLGTQGDPWDTQSDMFFALIGGGCALTMLSAWHDRQMEKIGLGGR